MPAPPNGVPPLAAVPTAPLAEVQVLRKSSSDAAAAAATANGTAAPQQQQGRRARARARSSSRSRSAGRGAGRGAGFRAQADALLRKNAVYQRRNWRSNACLLSAPVFFCLLLFSIQMAINRLLLVGDDYACGCKCTRCCFDGDPGNCTAVSMGTCPYACLEVDASRCGIQYSNARQSFFCAIGHPSSWPAVMQVPSEQNRAAPWRPRVALLHTGPDRALADRLASNLLPKPAATPANLLAVRSYLAGWNESAGGAGDSVPGELLSLLGLTLGSSSRISAGMYIETALVREQLDALWPNGTCAKLGLAGKPNITLEQLVTAMVNESNPPAAAKLLNSQLQSMLDAAGGAGGLGGDGGGGLGGGYSLITDMQLNCTDVEPAWTEGAKELGRKLFCGYYQARCGGGGGGAQQLAGAYDWKDTGANRFAPDVYFNDTFGLPLGTQPTVYQRVPASFNLAVNAWLRTFLGPNVSASVIGVQETPKAAGEIRLDFSSLLGPLFFTWVVQMLLPIFLMQLVYEKEKRLRMMMKMHGLGDGAYWLVTYAWFWGLYVAYMAVFMGFGSAIGLKMFTRNSAVAQIVLYFFFGHNMIAFSFLLSCFFASSKTATVFAYLVVFGTGLIGSLLLSQLIAGGLWYIFVIELVPSFALFRGLFEFGEYAFLAVYRNGYGMALRNLNDPGNGMIAVWIILAAEWPVFMGLAWYLEQVFASGTGNRRHPLFFLDCLRKGRKAATNARLAAAAASASEAAGEAEDVAAEHARVRTIVDYGSSPIVVRDLKKVYPGEDGQPPKLAVRQLNLAIERGECFGLLGPNGAGKSTSINMMVGLLEPTAGTALIGGHDITTEMDSIYGVMGVCPQHDLLWESLTGREHLLFYGRLKGLKGQALTDAVESGLRSVNLWNGGVADKPAAAYSGGMKRRLSVAISFAGDPLVVYLDEPSTGLDPASRRNLWDVVRASKAGRGVILTTHSMEEAETLCDRLGIFVDGALVCIGNPKEITSRYGGYLVMTLTVAPGQEGAARAFVARLSPGARLTYSVGGTLKFELPSEEASLSQVFSAMAEAKAGGGLDVIDWGVSNATLEEVFIRIARSVGAKAGD
ncbi:ABC transporter A family member protein [Raphidocelis subcapitata]|uniref:ABC transporter A family member protein n=1 Tax=Raphidocelis subcapitata TaxID=307507 RepID=A0A2V0NMK8_9CHLO|nr:ABC transporter A family member protein [Raphidocelis subcapitata]|eukprot:GBF88379.1 ABC transporter A family member protein [Raphidocelis subcapitata]